MVQMPFRHPRTQNRVVEAYVVLAAGYIMSLICLRVAYLLLNPDCSLSWFSSNFFSSLVVKIFVNSLNYDGKQTGL